MVLWVAGVLAFRPDYKFGEPISAIRIQAGQGMDVWLQEFSACAADRSSIQFILRPVHFISSDSFLLLY